MSYSELEFDVDMGVFGKLNCWVKYKIEPAYDSPKDRVIAIKECEVGGLDVTTLPGWYDAVVKELVKELSK